MVPAGQWNRIGRKPVTKWESGPEGHKTLEVTSTLIQRFDVTINGVCGCGYTVQGTSASESNAKMNMRRKWVAHYREEGVKNDGTAAEMGAM
jgi:hypothetical protein